MKNRLVEIESRGPRFPLRFQGYRDAQGSRGVTQEQESRPALTTTLMFRLIGVRRNKKLVA